MTGRKTARMALAGFLAAALLHCPATDSGVPQPAVGGLFPPTWRGLGRSADGWSYRLWRPGGAQHLVIAVPEGRDGVAELQPKAERWAKRGFALLTMQASLDQAAEAPEASELRNRATTELILFGLRRGGYHSRSVLLPQNDPEQQLAILASREEAVAAIVLLGRPGWRPRTMAARSLLQQLSDRSLLLSFQALDRYVTIDHKRPEIGPRLLGTRSNDSFPDSDALDWLELARWRPQWRPAVETFAAGCYAERPELNLDLAAVRTSGVADDFSCPMYLARNRELLFAEYGDAQECHYRSQNQRIRCRP